MAVSSRLTNFVNLAKDEKVQVLSWRNHEENRKYFYDSSIVSDEEHFAFIEKLKADQKSLYFKCGDLGVVSLTKINLSVGNAYLGIYVNPFNSERGKGSYILGALLKYAFNILGLHTVKLEVFSSNTKAISFYEKSGFVIEGRLRDFWLIDQGRCDVLVMGILRSEFLEKRL